MFRVPSTSLALIVALSVGTPVALRAQAPKTALGPDGAPIWTRVVPLSDGRKLVTDGAISLDAALAQPKALPTTVLAESSGRVLEKYMAAPLEHEFAVSELTAGTRARTYVSPTAITLEADYVDYLARTLGSGRLRLRMQRDLDPVVILLDGKPVGLVMAMRGAAARE